MAQFDQSADTNHTLGVCLWISRPQFSEPLPHGSSAIGILEEKQLCVWQSPFSLSQRCDNVNPLFCELVIRFSSFDILSIFQVLFFADQRAKFAVDSWAIPEKPWDS
jgi:hypothetical protein